MDNAGTTPQNVVTDWDNLQIDGGEISEILPEYHSNDHVSDDDSLRSQDSLSSDDDFDYNDEKEEGRGCR